MDLETLRGVNFLTLGESTPSGEVIKYLSLPTVWQQVCSARMRLHAVALCAAYISQTRGSACVRMSSAS
jgi:hypothetical protein